MGVSPLSAVLKTVGGMFSGKAKDEASRTSEAAAAANQAEADQQRNLQQVAQQRQESAQRAEQDRVSGAVRAAKQPRGSRLLISSESGGLATKLGASA